MLHRLLLALPLKDDVETFAQQQVLESSAIAAKNKEQQVCFISLAEAQAHSNPFCMIGSTP